MPRVPDPRLWRDDRVSQGYVAAYKPFVFVDGEGVRCSLYVAGCLFQCEGCFNREAWSFRCGEPYSRELEDRVMADLAHPAVQGLSLLGGEPFLNTRVCLAVVRRLRAEFGSSRDIWAWSGFTFEQLIVDSQDKQDLLAQIDVLVDGPFEEDLKNLSLAFRGSTNQRVLSVPDSRERGHAVTWKGSRQPVPVP